MGGELLQGSLYAAVRATGKVAAPLSAPNFPGYCRRMSDVWTRPPLPRVPALRLLRAAERVRMGIRQFEAALAQADPVGVEADVWRGTAVIAAAAGDVALARQFVGGPDEPLLAWPAHSEVPALVVAVRELLSVLRWEAEAQDTPPRSMVVTCLTSTVDALDDIDAIWVEAAQTL